MTKKKLKYLSRYSKYGNNDLLNIDLNKIDNR